MAGTHAAQWENILELMPLDMCMNGDKFWSLHSLAIALDLGAALTSNSGQTRVFWTKRRRDKEGEITVITDIAVPLLEVESACNYRLRCKIGWSTKLVWLHIIGIAPSTPREDILELMPLDVFIPADESWSHHLADNCPRSWGGIDFKQRACEQNIEQRDKEEKNQSHNNYRSHAARSRKRLSS